MESDTNEPGATRPEDVAESAAGQAGGIAEQTREQARSMADSGREQLAERFASLGRALHVTGDHLRSENRPHMSRYADLAAEKVEQTARYLRERDADTLLGEVEHTILRRPGLFVGGALGAGVMLGRFLRSSERRRPSAAAEVGEAQPPGPESETPIEPEPTEGDVPTASGPWPR